MGHFGSSFYHFKLPLSNLFCRRRIRIVCLSRLIWRKNFVLETLTYLWINISCAFTCLTAGNSSLWMSIKQIIHCCLQVSSIYSFSLFNILISDWILIMAIDCLISIYILSGFQNETSNLVLKSSDLIGQFQNQPDGSHESIHSLFRHPRRTVMIWRPSFFKF